MFKSMYLVIPILAVSCLDAQKESQPAASNPNFSPRGEVSGVYEVVRNEVAISVPLPGLGANQIIRIFDKEILNEDGILLNDKPASMIKNSEGIIYTTGLLETKIPSEVRVEFDWEVIGRHGNGLGAPDGAYPQPAGGHVAQQSSVEDNVVSIEVPVQFDSADWAIRVYSKKFSGPDGMNIRDHPIGMQKESGRFVYTTRLLETKVPSSVRVKFSWEVMGPRSN